MTQERGGTGDRKEIGGKLYEKVSSPTGEWVDRSKNLLKPENAGSEKWRRYRVLVDPRPSPESPSLYEGLGINVPKWDGLVEHNLAVSAGSRTLAAMLNADVGIATQAGAIQDAGKAYDLEEKKKSREVLGDETILLAEYINSGVKAEGLDTKVVDDMLRTGCSRKAIVAALNTGRLPDRYIQDQDARMAAIRARGVEANVVAYVDARTLNSTIVPSLDDARNHYLEVKPDEKSQKFFKVYWTTYFKDVERYLEEQSGGRFDHTDRAKDITNEKIFNTVSTVVDQSPS